RRRPRRHRRLQLRRRSPDPRHPDRDGHVQVAPRPPRPETTACRGGRGGGMTSFADDPCARCEELIQPFLDRELNEVERLEAEAHLSLCSYCRKRYRFEEHLRRFVRQAVVVE